MPRISSVWTCEDCGTTGEQPHDADSAMKHVCPDTRISKISLYDEGGEARLTVNYADDWHQWSTRIFKTREGLVAGLRALLIEIEQRGWTPSSS